MSGHPWTPGELAALDEQLPWESFHALYPARSYDSWEVKRRRVGGGSAGTRRRHNISALRLLHVLQALRTLTEYFEGEAARG